MFNEYFFTYVAPTVVTVIAIADAIRRQKRWGDTVLKYLKQLNSLRYDGISSISVKKMTEEAKAIMSCLKIIYGVAAVSEVVHVGYFIIHNGELDILLRHIWKASMRHEIGAISMIESNQNVSLDAFLKPLREIEQRGYSVQDEHTKISKLKFAIKTNHFKNITYFGIIVKGVPTFIISVATFKLLTQEQIQAIQKQLSILYAYFANELDNNTKNLLQDDTD